MKKKHILIVVIILAAIITSILFIPKIIYNNKRPIKALNYDKAIEVNEMLADIDQLEHYIKTVHPSSVDGIKEEVQNEIDFLKAEIKEPMAAGEFYFKLNKITNALGDAHTSIGLVANRKELPYSFEYVEDKIVCKKDSDVFKKGDIVVKVGDMEIDEYINLIKQNIPAENVHWQNKLSAHYFKRDFYLKHFGLLEDDKVKITYERDGEIFNAEIKVESLDTSSNDDYKFVEYKLHENNIGVIKIDSCIYNDVYKNTLAEAFALFNKENVTTLVIDVRYNTGGNSRCFNELMSYIDVESYNDFTGQVRGSWQSWLQRSLLFSTNSSKDKVTINKQKDVELFKSDIYVLTSGYTFSSGNWFAVTLRDNNLATVVGEPTGNKPSSYGDVMIFTLNNSGIKMQMSFKTWFRPDSELDDEISLYPDILIEKTIDDVKNDVDSVMEYIIEITN